MVAHWKFIVEMYETMHDHPLFLCQSIPYQVLFYSNIIFSTMPGQLLTILNNFEWFILSQLHIISISMNGDTININWYIDCIIPWSICIYIYIPILPYDRALPIYCYITILIFLFYLSILVQCLRCFPWSQFRASQEWPLLAGESVSIGAGLWAKCRCDAHQPMNMFN